MPFVPQMIGDVVQMIYRGVACARHKTPTRVLEKKEVRAVNKSLNALANKKAFEMLKADGDVYDRFYKNIVDVTIIRNMLAHGNGNHGEDVLQNVQCLTCLNICNPCCIQMDSDLKAIKNLSLDLRRVEYNLLDDTSSISTQLAALNNALGRLKASQREKMMANEKYHQAFYILRYDLQSTIKTSKDVQLIKMRDQIFGSKLKGMFDEEQKQYKTFKVFVKFIEGITCFVNERPYNMRDLIYHRNGSCSKNGNGNFDCIKTNDRRSNTHMIEKCFIERLIYDQLWLQIEQIPQDIKHVELLEKTRQAYTSCVPFGYIEIKIAPYKIMPEKLTIEKYIEGVCVDTEIYTKRWNKNKGLYDDLVHCMKFKPIIKSIYTKDQTYYGETTWENLNPRLKTL
jgi:hypothetical protein